MGHLYTIVLTDILKRWAILLGDQNATLLTGTDEHGMKIQKAAHKAKTDVKLFCDQHARQFQQLADAANISYDRFIRTTDEDHKAAVEHFWRELNHQGYIYESKHEGWYSVSDETFYPESQIHLVLEPSTGRKMYASIETGKEVEWTSETNYHFRLSAFRDKLLEHYNAHPDFIVPKPRMNFIVREVESGLSDLSISRPSSRLSWGIPVPGDDSQTIYVWLDALINYVTMAGYPFSSTADANALWPPNCQVIGKDIVRFHCVYWPAFLMALNLPLPKQLLTHAHWTMNNAKMSKSSGNGVNPFYAMERFGVDTIRFFMAHDGGIVDDADYENSYVVERYKKALQGGFGNLLYRIVKSKNWNVRESVAWAQQRPDARLDEAVPLRRLIQEVPGQAVDFMEKLDPRQALHTIMQLVYSVSFTLCTALPILTHGQTNKYFQNVAPWNITRNSAHPAVDHEVNRIIFLSAEAVRIAAILLQPFMPEKMRTALDMLGVHESKRTINDAIFGADFSYGTSFIESGDERATKTLFPPLKSEW